MSAADNDPRHEVRQLDREAYPWQWQVRDRFGRPRPFGFGVTVEDGKVVAAVVGPDYWTADPATCQQIQFAWAGLCQRVADEQELRDQRESGS